MNALRVASATTTLLILSSLGSAHAETPAQRFVKHMGPGVNYGNTLEATPSEGSWGPVVKPNDAILLRDKGFRHIRIPIRWEPRTATTTPFAISPVFLTRLDTILAWARSANMMAVLNAHHHDSLFANFEAQKPRFLATWAQIAEHFKNLPADSIAFEILNEPHAEVNSLRWNALLQEALDTIRAHDPTRTVVIGTANWGGLGGLDGLVWPKNDSNLILTVHYYDPFSFTHQGAEWVDPIPPLGVRWTGDFFEKSAVKNDMLRAKEWSEAHGVPVWVGEFGSYSKGDTVSRGLWTAYCARVFESLGFSWSYWEYKAGFGVYDESAETWNAFLTGALLSTDTSVLKIPEAATGGIDQVRNGNFAGGKTGWTLNDGAGVSTFTLDAGRAMFTISEAQAENWRVQFLQGKQRLLGGHSYVLSFRAWASRPRGINGSVDNSTKYNSYGNVNARLGTEPRTFFAVVKPPLDDSTARIAFNIGDDTATVWLDDVQLLELSQTGIGNRSFSGNTNQMRQMGENLLWFGTIAPPSNLVSTSGRRVAKLKWLRTSTGFRATLPVHRPGLTYLQGTHRPIWGF